MTPFGLYVRQLRKQNNLTLKELSSSLEVSYTFLCYLEHGKLKTPNESLISKITEVFKLDNQERIYLSKLASISTRSIKLPSTTTPAEYDLAHSINSKLSEMNRSRVIRIETVFGPTVNVWVDLDCHKEGGKS